jgi:hypothetical protein
MIERLPRGQFPVNAVIGREGKRELLPMWWDHFPLFVHLINGTGTRRQFIPQAARLGSFVRHRWPHSADTLIWDWVPLPLAWARLFEP